MDIQITTLSENTASYGFLGEWGLSILIEVDGKQILLDTGPGASTVKNADRLGVDLSKIDAIVLSHGHADHTGGLLDVLDRTGGCEVIAHPGIWVTRYTERKPGAIHEISMPFSRLELEKHGARFNLGNRPVKISERIMTTGEIEMVTSYEAVDGNLYMKGPEGLQPDSIADDMALLIDADYGLVVILGCAHRGLINTLRHAQKLTGKEKIYAVIGGTHLVRASAERIEKIVAELKTMQIERLGVSHCTGFAASARMSQEFDGTFFLNNAGARFSLPF